MKERGGRGGEVESTEIIEQRAWKSQDSIEKALTSQSEKPLMDVKQPAKTLWIPFPHKVLTYVEYRALSGVFQNIEYRTNNT
jgi:hypothetical protein